MSRDTIYRLLQEGVKKKDIAAGRHAHSLMACTGLDSLSVLADHLIRLLAGCGQLQEAHCTFCRIFSPTVYTWNAIISAHAQLGEAQKALELYFEMQQHGTLPNKFVFLSVLKVCSSIKDPEQGRKVFEEIKKHNLPLDLIIGNTAIDMFAKCGSMDEARMVFNELQDPDLVSWSVLIAGYAQCGCILAALELYEQMHRESLVPNQAIFLSMLKLCSHFADGQCGRVFHSEIVKTGLENDTIVVNILVDMHARFGSLDDACNTFHKLANRDVVSWGVMIAGCTQHADFYQALELFNSLQHEGFYPSNVTFSCILNACGHAGFLNQARMIHSQVLWHGLKADVVIANTLLDVYAKCGSMKEAECVFNSLQDRDVVSWGAMISTYAQQGQALAAFELFKQMQEGSIKPNKAVFLWLLKASTSLESLPIGKSIHYMIVDHDIDLDVAVGSTLIDMYIKCTSLDDAHSIFVHMPERDAMAWGAMILGNVQHGHNLIALTFLDYMQFEGIKPDRSIFLSILKTNDRSLSIHEVRLMHNQLLCFGFELDTSVGKTLMELYGKNDGIDEAHKVFTKMLNPDLVSWNTIVTLSIQHGSVPLAFELLATMHKLGLRPDRVVLLCLLQACSMASSTEWGKLVHCEIIEGGLDSEVTLGSTLIDMYAKCGCISDAINMFDNLHNRNMVSWGALISGYVQEGLSYSALELFELMLQEGVQASDATLVCSLKACASLGTVSLGRVIHCHAIAIGSHSNTILESMLVDMYARCGSLQDAYTVFEKMPTQNAASWSAMISGYAHNGLCHQGLELFEKMNQDGFRPTKTTFLYALKACSDVGALGHARLIHDLITASGMSVDAVIGNALIDVYAHCGRMDEASMVFNTMSSHDVVSFSLLIEGFSKCNNCASALRCINGMQEEDMILDDMILTNILAACSHDGLWEEACFYFNLMKEKHKVKPGIEHYNCIVDVLGRAGYLFEAESMLRTMPIPPDVVGWRALLTCSQLYKNVDLGLRCYDEINLLDLEDPSSEVLILNVHRTENKWKGTETLLLS